MKTIWGVRVNEVGIFASASSEVREWWARTLAPWERSGRALCLGICPQGGVWFLPAGQRDDAEWMRDHITGHGVHPRMVKLTTQDRANAEVAA